MHPFNKKIAIRIGIATCLLALLFGYGAWSLSFMLGEKFALSQTIQTTQQLTESDGPFRSGQKLTADTAHIAAKNMVIYGIFDMVEIFDNKQQKLAEYESVNSDFSHVEFGSHGNRSSWANGKPFYESRKLSDGRRAISVDIPISSRNQVDGPIMDYVEALRIVPPWREAQMRLTAYLTALLVGLATLIGGATLYPLVVNLNKQKDHKAQQLFRSNILVMKSLGDAIARRDAETGSHNYRVTIIALRIARAMNFDLAKMESLIVGSFLHDIGKIAISDAILLKPQKLSEEEKQIMKTHVQHGEEIVKNKDWLHEAHDVISAHHEKWDGSGYPRGLSGNEIPLAARIFAVADVFDALTSKRPYKEAFSFDVAISLINDGSGSQFDPEVVKIFSEIAAEIYEEISVATESQMHNELDMAIDEYLRISLS